MSARQLTERDLYFIQRTAQSATRKQIADELARSPKTVEWRAVEVGKKLGICPSDVAAITRYAISNGMIVL